MTSVFVDPAEPTRDDLLAQLAALQGRFASLAVIEQAKGALMVTYGLTADPAFDLLRFHSQTGNVKLRIIADELTSLLSTGTTSSEAVTRFDRLIDTVTRNLQTPPGPQAEPAAAGAAVDMAALWSQIAADQNPRAAAPPGITIAANAPGLPLVYANEAFADLTGYPVGDVLGRNCRFLQGPATDPRDITTLSRALHTGRDFSVVLRNYRNDGSLFLNKVSISQICNRADQITHYIGTQSDVTPPTGENRDHIPVASLPKGGNP